MLTHDRYGVPELVDVHCFTRDWEKRASLDFRHGHTDVIDTYDEYQRIVDGDTEGMIDSAYAAWRSDLVAGQATVLVSDSNESVTALNNRARTDLILKVVPMQCREEVIRVLRLHVPRVQTVGGEVAEVLGDDHFRFGLDSGGQHMPIVRIREPDPDQHIAQC